MRGTYYRQGDYDAAIGYYLRGTQLVRRGNPPLARTQHRVHRPAHGQHKRTPRV